MTQLGVFILVVSLLIYVLDPLVERLLKYDTIRDDRKWILLALAGFSLILIFNPFYRTEAGYRTFVETINGNEKVFFKPGFHYAGFFSKNTDYPDVITTVFTSDEEGVTDGNEAVTSIEPAFIIRFNDATKATAQATIRWSLPTDEETMVKIHRAYRSPTRLAKTSLIPYARECLKFAAQLMESETHYSGGRSKLKEDFRDQLQNGQYVLEYKTEYVMDTLTKERQKITTSYIRRGNDGQATRIESDIQQYEIHVNFAAIDEVDYEEQVDKKLAQKIEQSTLESVSKQALITAQQEALTEKARGEQMLAKVKAEQEADKLQAVIQAQKAKEVAREEALQAKYIADKIAEEGRAQAEANRALVSAGLTPVQRMNMEIEIADKVSANMAQIQFPEIMIFGGGKDSPTNPFDAVGLEAYRKMVKQIGKSK
jgi:regulator of protease activity HflC (stomatin/prohibitin superfamily)